MARQLSKTKFFSKGGESENSTFNPWEESEISAVEEGLQSNGGIRWESFNRELQTAMAPPISDRLEPSRL